MARRIVAVALRGTAKHFPALGKEIVSFRTQYSRTFESPDGGYVARTFPSAVNYRAADGSFQPIDDQLTSAAGGFVNQADSYRAFLPARLGGPAVQVRTARASVSMSLLGARGVAAVSGSRAVYANALPGVSLSYTTLSGRVKESLTLARAGTRRHFAFRLRFPSGLRPRLGRGGVVRVLDRKGKVRLVLATPSMSDAAPRVGGRLPARGRVGVALSRRRGGWLLVLRPDGRWLSSSARRFPVVIDPTVDLGPNADCTIAGGIYADSNFCAQTQSQDYIGNDGVPLRALLSFPAVRGAVPADAQVISARVGVDVTGLWTPGSPLTVSAYAVTRKFQPTTTTWNSYDGYSPDRWTTPGGDFDSAPLDTHSISGAGWYYFDVTPLVQSWADGSRDANGIILKEPAPESAMNVAQFNSGRVNTPAFPYVDVAYNPRLGEPRGATIRRTQLSDRMSLGVNVANGNLTVHNSDLNVTGTGLDQSIDRTYNNLSPYAGEPGNGWTMNSARGYAYLASFGARNVVYGAPDGALYVFDYNSSSQLYDPTQAYVPPPGINATLCNVFQPNCQAPSGTLFRMTFHDGEVLYFDTAGHQTSAADQNANQLSYAYNANGTTSQSTDTQGRQVTFGYASNPYLLASASDAAGGRSTHYGQDAAGDLTSYTDAAGAQTLYAYDASRNLTQITDPAGHVTKLAYDPNGRVTQVTQVTNNQTGAGDSTTYAYQGAAYGIALGCPSIPSGGLSIAGFAFQKTVVTDPRGNQTSYCADTHDRVYVAYDAQGHTRQSGYTNNDDQTQSSLPSGAISNAMYDNTDRLYQGIEPASAKGQTSASESLGYNGSTVAPPKSPCPASGGHPFYPDSDTDPQGNPLCMGYDAHNNLQSVKSPGASSGVTINRNANGTPSSSVDGNQNQTGYGYDGQGNLTGITPPVPLASQSIGYDAVSRETSFTDGNQKTTQYRYDTLDRLTETDHADGSKITYAYDPDGNLTQRADSSTGTSNYAYDLKGRRTSETSPGVNNTYGYDPAGNLASLTDAGGTVGYGYDNLNRLSSVQEPGASAAITLGYDMDDHRTSVSYPNGVTITNAYDNTGRLTSVKAARNGTPLTGFGYSYQTPSAPTADTDLVQSAGTPAGGTTTYTYDPLQRLTRALTTGPGADDRKYTLDAAGNITQTSINGQLTNYTYNASNQITNPGYRYDPGGNLLTRQDVGGSTTFAYNARNQTTQINPDGQGNQNLAYLGTGQNELTQTGSAPPGGSAPTATNNQLGVSSTTTAGASTYYTRDPDGNLLAERTPTGEQYPITDKLGSIADLTDQNGNLTNQYAYDPYGQTTSTTGTTPNLVGYAGGLQTPGGLYHYGARYYDPGVGRWTQQDPLNQANDPGQANRYAYVGGNPINLVDPSGLCGSFFSCALHAGGVILTTAETAASTAANGFAAVGCAVAIKNPVCAVPAAAAVTSAYGGFKLIQHEIKHF